MSDYIGFLLRKNRIEQNFTQENLCKGICAVSYLSKIEKGAVNANQDILERLFGKMCVSFSFDKEMLKKGQRLFDIFFDKYMYGEDKDTEIELINKLAEQIENSMLSLTYHIYLIYKQKDNRLEMAKQEIGFLTQFIDYMNDKEKFLYYFASHWISDDFVKRIEFLKKADSYFHKSFCVLRMAKCYLNEGMYQEALLYANNALTLANKEGNNRMMIESAYLIGHCYASINNIDLMLQSYAHAANLARGVDGNIKKQIDYNSGAVFVSVRRFDEAIPLLENALDADEITMRVLACHKLAIAYIETGKTDEGLEYIEKGYALLDDKSDEIYRKMLDLIKMRTKNGFLDSKDYGDLLIELYQKVGKYGFGFKIFHLKFLTQYCVHHRKYKEAFNLAAEYVDFLQ